jgi:chromosome partitioning protein
MLKNQQVDFTDRNTSSYFEHDTAKEVFRLKLPARAVAFQIIKGGTGKTSLAQSFAIRASLYGLKVLCIDLDQQGNLTSTFTVDAESYPIMVDILAEGYSFESAIIKATPGIDLLASRIENALLDDVIKLKQIPLDKVYKEQLALLKKRYDLIVIDCPPNLGQSVAAVTLGVDLVVAPVVPENFALSGLKVTANAIEEIEASYNVTIPFAIALNKYDPRTILSKEALETFKNHPKYSNHILPNCIRMSQEFPNAAAKDKSIFDVVKATMAKTDIDLLTREILGIDEFYEHKAEQPKKQSKSSSKLQAALV